MREPIVPQLDGPAFLLWEEAQADRFELHHGFIFAFAGGTADHDRAAFNARGLLERAFPPPCRTFGSDVKVRVARDTFYYPDVTVTCEPIAATTTVIERPQIAVEVLSPGTQAYDLADKRSAYRAMPTLEAYVIIHTRVPRIEIDRRDVAGWTTQTFDADDETTINGLLFTVRELYTRTTLETSA
jgi:Uma2 family endonuclease